MLYQYWFERRWVKRKIVSFLAKIKIRLSGELNLQEIDAIYDDIEKTIENQLRECTLTRLFEEYAGFGLRMGDHSLCSTLNHIREQGIDLELKDQGPSL